MDFAHCHPARVEREDLVVEPGEPALVLGNQLGLERAVAIARHVDRERAVLSQDRLGPRPIAVIGGVFRLGPARRIPEMVCQLAAERTLDDGFFEPPNGGVELLRTNRLLPNELVENL